MNKDKKLRLLLVPLIFIVLLHVPVMIGDIAYECMQESPEVIRIIFVEILCISMLIWCALFYHIPTSIYIAIVIVYTVVSWKWILKQKKGNAAHAIVWLVLCVLSILMYWKWGNLYHIMINR